MNAHSFYPNMRPVAVANDEAVAESAVAEPKEIPPMAHAMVDRVALTKAFDIAKNAADKKNSIPILANALLKAEGESIVIVTTDLDMEIRITVPAAIDSHFQMTAPAHVLDSFLKKAAACELVALTTQPEFGTATVEFERVKYRLQTLAVADFPAMTLLSEFTHYFELPGKTFWNMIDGTMAAISKEETRYYLNGIYAHALDSAFVLVATDGHRLYRQEIEAPNGVAGMPGIIIPRKMVELIHKLFRGKACPDEAALSVSANYVRVAFGNVEITSKLIDGTFPDYQRVIPQGAGFAMTFDRDAMAEALQSVSLISIDAGRAVKFEISDGACRLVINNPDKGSAESTIACGWQSDHFEFGVNYAYLERLLDDAGAGEIAMTFGEQYRPKRETDDGETERATPRADPGSPVRVAGPREGWTAVLMPMRI